MSKFKNRNTTTIALDKKATKFDIDFDKYKNWMIDTKIKYPDLSDHVHPNNFRLIFENYSLHNCQLFKFDKNLCEKLHNYYKNVTKTNGEKFLESGLAYKGPVHNSGEYEKYYDAAPKDVTIFHYPLSGTARIFFYIYSCYFCVLAITFDHAK